MTQYDPAKVATKAMLANLMSKTKTVLGEMFVFVAPSTARRCCLKVSHMQICGLSFVFASRLWEIVGSSC